MIVTDTKDRFNINLSSNTDMHNLLALESRTRREMQGNTNQIISWIRDFYYTHIRNNPDEAYLPSQTIGSLRKKLQTAADILESVVTNTITMQGDLHEETGEVITRLRQYHDQVTVASPERKLYRAKLLQIHEILKEPQKYTKLELIDTLEKELKLAKNYRTHRNMEIRGRIGMKNLFDRVDSLQTIQSGYDKFLLWVQTFLDTMQEYTRHVEITESSIDAVPESMKAMVKIKEIYATLQTKYDKYKAVVHQLQQSQHAEMKNTLGTKLASEIVDKELYR